MAYAVLQFASASNTDDSVGDYDNDDNYTMIFTLCKVSIPNIEPL